MKRTLTSLFVLAALIMGTAGCGKNWGVTAPGGDTPIWDQGPAPLVLDAGAVFVNEFSQDRYVWLKGNETGGHPFVLEIGIIRKNAGTPPLAVPSGKWQAFFGPTDRPGYNGAPMVVEMPIGDCKTIWFSGVNNIVRQDCAFSPDVNIPLLENPTPVFPEINVLAVQGNLSIERN